MTNKYIANIKSYFTYKNVNKIGKVSMPKRQFQKPSDVYERTTSDNS